MDISEFPGLGIEGGSKKGALGILLQGREPCVGNRLVRFEFNVARLTGKIVRMHVQKGADLYCLGVRQGRMADGAVGLKSSGKP